MNNNNGNSNNNFFNGFLLGALVGAAVVFFLGTKKGTRMLKAISEEGVDNISNLLDKASRAEDLDEVLDEEDEPSFAVASAGKGRNSQTKEKIIEEVKPKIKRFFRGISRRVN